MERDDAVGVAMAVATGAATHGRQRDHDPDRPALAQGAIGAPGDLRVTQLTSRSLGQRPRKTASAIGRRQCVELIAW